MFEIEYKGGNTVVISTKKTKLIADPKRSIVGLKDIDVKDAVELSTEPRLGLADPAARLIIDGPGEYEIGDFSIRGFAAARHIDTELDEKLATIYRIEIADARIALLGNVAPKLSDDQLEDIGVVDILILPIGGGGLTLDATSATTLARRIDPKVVIPVHYAEAGLSYEVPQDSLETFMKELGAQAEEIAPKYKVKTSAAFPQVLTVVPVERT